ncbi:MAG TPA: sulfotransferase [Gemmatimonadales bacterium]|nr:sulfotransferase [Gemmatimonadales bacterium]
MTDSEAGELEGGGTEGSSGRPVADPAPFVFVGGTGRSGTHVIARLLSRHPHFALVPVEVRFHVEERGFPGLLAGRVSRDDFVSRLRGFWWKGFQTGRMRGMFRFVGEQRFEKAIAAFEAGFGDDPEAACRQLYRDLLWFRVAEADARGLVEQSTDTVAQAATLVRLFEEAKFIHVVRDGRDASASRVAQTRGVISPRTRRQGLEWWEERIRRVDAGSRAIPPDRLLTVSLDELLLLGPGALRPLCRFLGVYRRDRMRRFFRLRMSAEHAHAERWREGLSERQTRELERLYEQALDRLEADGVACAPLLRRTLDRSRASADDGPPPLAFVTGDSHEMEVG